MSRESSDKIPYGKPKLPINITFIPEGAGGKLIYESKYPDLDEYLDVIVGPIDTKEKKYTGEGAQVTFINSPSTKIIQGQLGNEIADLTVTSLNTLLQNFERDVHKLDGLIKNRNSAKDTFDYMGSSAFIDTENLEPYIKYHEQIKEQTKGSRLEPDPKKVFRDEATGVVIDWNKTSDDPTVSKEEDEKNKKVLLNTLTEAIKRTKRPQPEETIKDMVNNVKQALSLNNIEYDQIMIGTRKVKERISQEASMIEQQQKSVSKMKSFAQLEGVDSLIESSKPDLTSETPDNSFDVAMAMPDSSMLAKKYASISSTQKEQLRKRWKSNEKRLKLLIAELIEAPQNKCPTICNNYIDLLISEDYPTLMKSYLRYNAIQNEQEKNRLTFLNEFVISLYKDQAIYLLHDEHLQLQKIEEIIQWALEDFQNLNDLLEENKHKYDVNFVSYLNLAISKEVERIKKQYGNTPLSEATAKSYEHPWLCLLTIIQRAIYSMAEADMAEDCYILTTIINFEDPLVRSYMLELFLATMPRSDWKAFKDLIISASNSLINKPPEERTDLKGTEPHFVEAVMQLRDEVEKMIPDWIIDELLSEDDRMYMIENNKRKSPLMQLQLEPKESTPDAAQKLKDKEIYIDKQTVSVKK
uniref:Uncharacterized protein n=1 Tax=Babesia bovis TaxID=5865 RepID=A7AMV8_BABBO|eukprot:XP_001611460.1 hypothetical protein [Babesia bovis T2Bo]